MTQFKEGDRIVRCQDSKEGAVMAAYSPVLWILWDQDTIPSTVAEDRVKLVPKIPEVGKVYGGDYGVRRLVVGIVPENEHTETLVNFQIVGYNGKPDHSWVSVYPLELFWKKTPHLIN